MGFFGIPILKVMQNNYFLFRIRFLFTAQDLLTTQPITQPKGSRNPFEAYQSNKGLRSRRVKSV